MKVVISEVISAIWFVVLIAFVATAGVLKPKAATEPIHVWIRRAFLLGMSLLLLFSSPRSESPLSWRLLPASDAIEWVGCFLTLAGAGFAIWARLWLGSNWSFMTTVRGEHDLVKSGPYAIVRHPIYSGLIIGMTGTAVVLGEIRGFIGVLVAAIIWWRKANAEESLLLDRFGSEYLLYAKKVRRLF